MKNTRFIALLLVLCMAIAAFTACKTETQNPESSIVESSQSAESSEISEESKEPERIDGTEKYKAAAYKLENSENIKIKAAYELTVTVGTETRKESGTSTETYLSYGEKDMKYYSESETVYGDGRKVKAVETMLDGNVFLAYGENLFCGPAESEYSLFIADPELYGEITELPEKDKDGNTVITLINAERVENWLAYEYATVDTASAELVLNDEGDIVSFEYTAKFDHGAAQKEMKYSFETVSLGSETPVIEVPKDAKNYLSVKSVSAMVLMDEAINNMKSLGTYGYQSTCLMEALNMTIHSTSTQYDSFKYGNDFAAKFNMQKELAWYDLKTGKVREDNVENETSIIDGVMKRELNGIKDSKKIKDDELADFVAGHLDTVLFCVPELSDITEIEVEAIDGYLMITAKCSKKHGEKIYDEMSKLLNGFDDLVELTDSFKSGKNEFVITVDLDTYYPTAICVDYEGTFKVEGYEYTMGMERNTALFPANPDSYFDITEKHHPAFDEEPEEEEKATPLFYKVTDANGNVMWLLGTIHVGDNRTAYLPQEIYDAFNDSDAAAFEIDVVELNEDFEDPSDKLLDLYYEAMLYDDDTIDEHIDETLYRDASKIALILGLGNYGDDYIGTLDMYRPTRWSELISGYYAKHMLGVYYNKGVDMRLLTQAHAEDKKVYEIENRYRSYKMDIELSDEVHEYLLIDAVNYTRSYLAADSIAMYEAWCDGDIEKLTEMINEQPDFSEMTEEEKKAYEEYSKALNDDRDALMLEKAKEYIASDETVFFAVGLAHLLDNETGLVKTLTEAGYTVELVEYGA